jgi:hypothetical protein
LHSAAEDEVRRRKEPDGTPWSVNALNYWADQALVGLKHDELQNMAKRTFWRSCGNGRPRNRGSWIARFGAQGQRRLQGDRYRRAGVLDRPAYVRRAQVPSGKGVPQTYTNHVLSLGNKVDSNFSAAFYKLIATTKQQCATGKKGAELAANITLDGHVERFRNMATKLLAMEKGKPGLLNQWRRFLSYGQLGRNISDWDEGLGLSTTQEYRDTMRQLETAQELVAGEAQVPAPAVRRHLPHLTGDCHDGYFLVDAPACSSPPMHRHHAQGLIRSRSPRRPQQTRWPTRLRHLVVAALASAAAPTA